MLRRNTHDVLAITSLIHSSADAIDSGNFDRLGEIFASGTFQHNGKDKHTGQQVVDLDARSHQGLRRRHTEDSPRHYISLDGKNTTAYCYYLVLESTTSRENMEIISAGAYDDTSLRIKRVWRFESRSVSRHFTGDLSKQANES